jgi:DNA-binding MarR family transcriptional regulator
MEPAGDLRALSIRVMRDCACQNVRKTARGLTQHYDRAFAPVKLKATQFPILVALAVAGTAPLSFIAQVLGMDRTTLTRNLRPLEERRFIQTGEGEDRRIRELSLTAEGQQVLREALELWKVAQRSVTESFGADSLATLLGDLDRLTEGLPTAN